MKKKAMIQRALSVFLAAGMLMATCSTAGAQDQETTTYVSPEDAACVAESLVDSLAGMVCIWTEDTAIEDVVELYDESGNPTAYSFELATNGVDTGYVIISARYDVPNMILEFADEAAPLYDEMDIVEGDTVLYTGALDYYKESADGNH